MKRSIAVFLVVFLTTSAFFPWSKDKKYSKIADKAFQEIKQNETSDDAPSRKESGHSSTVKKVLIITGIATLAVVSIGAGVKLSKNKYKKVAEKAFEAAKEME